MSKAAGIIALIIAGLIVADFVRNPKGTAAAGNAVIGFQKTYGNQLLGSPAR